MGLLARIFGAVSLKEMNGIRLDTSGSFWDISGKSDFPKLLQALLQLLPDGCVL
jgi:hypothetical protein